MREFWSKNKLCKNEVFLSSGAGRIIELAIWHIWNIIQYSKQE